MFRVKWAHSDAGFLSKHRKYEGNVPKKDRSWLKRAVDLSRSQAMARSHKGLHSFGGRRPVMNRGVTPDRVLVRSRGQQGAPFKTAAIREYLWDWFVDFRGSVASTISPKFVLARARFLAKLVLQENLKQNSFTDIPTLDKIWLLRWKRDFGGSCSANLTCGSSAPSQSC